jgi:hypothetical protein
MSKALVELQGRRLALDEYFEDYERRFQAIGGSGSWKIERQQEFAEPGLGSWEAFKRGDWPSALKLLDEMRPALAEYFSSIARQGIAVRRVRVVEEPISPYLIWELNGLRIRTEYGEQVRVVSRDQVESLERKGPLPEILVLGKKTVYQVLYDKDGAAEGAIRSEDGKEVERWVGLARRLYEVGEDLSSYFARKVSGLRPPGAR